MNEQQYTDLKNAINAIGGKAQQAFEKAGTATQIGYEIVKSRIIAESIVTIIVTVIACIILILIFFYFKKERNKFNEEHKENAYASWFNEGMNEAAVTIWFVFFAATLFVLLPMSFFACINLMSPDYAAITKIIDIYKSIK
jgi:ABC-type Fe3+ transport system permease subunit